MAAVGNNSVTTQDIKCYKCGLDIGFRRWAIYDRSFGLMHEACPVNYPALKGQA